VVATKARLTQDAGVKGPMGVRLAY